MWLRKQDGRLDTFIGLHCAVTSLLQMVSVRSVCECELHPSNMEGG